MTGMWIPPDILDRTAKTPAHYRIRCRRSVQIDTVVLHQTSFSRGSVPDNYTPTLRKSGNPPLPRAVEAILLRP
jgi:hypothetical protein